MEEKQNMNVKTCASSNEVKYWEDIDFEAAENHVIELQQRIAKAYQEKRYNKVKSLQFMLINSFYAKALAIKRTLEAKGARTPGVDNVVWSNSNITMKDISELNSGEYSPLPLKRKYIPKSNGKLRPLDIPTMKDKAMQTLYKFALEPIAEITADPHSYAYRPNRCTQDAIKRCVEVFSPKSEAAVTPEWILQIDIENCFGGISHEWLMENIPIDKVFLQKLLKNSYKENGKLFPITRGVPQGGPISAIICNMALDGLERNLRNRFLFTTEYYVSNVNVIRYADDIIITGSSEQFLRRDVLPVVREFLKKRGLLISPVKTVVVNINEGFDFLGWNIRKDDKGMVIIPSDGNYKGILDKISKKIRSKPHASQNDLCIALKPLLVGYMNYHKNVVSKQVLNKAERDIRHHIVSVTNNSQFRYIPFEPFPARSSMFYFPRLK